MSFGFGIASFAIGMIALAAQVNARNPSEGYVWATAILMGALTSAYLAGRADHG